MLIFDSATVRRQFRAYLDGHLGFTAVNGFATGEQEEVIKEGKNFAAGLMNGGDDSSSVSGEILDGLDDKERGGAVEAGGRLVEKQETGADEDLERNAEPLLLPAADASHLPVSDLAIGAFEQPDFHDRCFNDVVDVFL